MLESKINQELINKEDKIRGFLMGLFLACGSCNSPKTSNYHFEFYVSDENLAKIQKIRVVLNTMNLTPDEISSFNQELQAILSKMNLKVFMIN